MVGGHQFGVPSRSGEWEYWDDRLADVILVLIEINLPLESSCEEYGDHESHDNEVGD